MSLSIRVVLVFPFGPDAKQIRRQTSRVLFCFLKKQSYSVVLRNSLILLPKETVLFCCLKKQSYYVVLTNSPILLS